MAEPENTSRRSAKDYVSAGRAHDHERRSAKSPSAGVQGPLKGPGKSRALDALMLSESYFEAF